MATLTRSITVDAPVETAFDFALDIGRFWSCWPDVAMRDVELRRDGVGSTARAYTHFLFLHLEGSVEYTEVTPNRRIVAKVSFTGESPTWVFTFEPQDGGSRLTAEAEWHVPVPGVGQAIEGSIVKGHERELEKWLANVKTRIEEVVATSRPHRRAAARVG